MTLTQCNSKERLDELTKQLHEAIALKKDELIRERLGWLLERGIIYFSETPLAIETGRPPGESSDTIVTAKIGAQLVCDQYQYIHRLERDLADSRAQVKSLSKYLGRDPDDDWGNEYAAVMHFKGQLAAERAKNEKLVGALRDVECTCNTVVDVNSLKCKFTCGPHMVLREVLGDAALRETEDGVKG